MHLNPITGNTKTYRSNQGSAMPATDSQRAMRVLSNPHSDNLGGVNDDLEYLMQNSGSFNLVDMKIALDPDA